MARTIHAKLSDQILANTDQFWLADVSHIPTDEGWLCLAAIKDTATREILGWSMAGHLRAELCLDALVMAIRRHGPPPRGLIQHSDSKSALPVPGGLTRTAIGRPVGWHREASRGGLTRTLIDQEACLSPDLSAAGNASR